MRRLAKLLLYLILLALLVAALIIIWRAGPFAQQVRSAVMREISQQVNRQVSIEGISLSATGQVVLHDVVVRNNDGSTFFTAPELDIRLGNPESWLPILSGPTEIQQVRLVRPEITIVRETSGEWDFSDLLVRKPARKPMKAKIVIQDGRLTVIDRMNQGLTTELERVNFTLSQQPVMVFNVEAMGTGGIFDRLTIKGRSEGPNGSTTAMATITDLDLGYAYVRLPEIKAVHVSGGRGDIRSTLNFSYTGSAQPVFDYKIEIEAKDGVVKFPWLRKPVSDVQGKVRIENGDIFLDDLVGNVTGAPVKANGTISDLPEANLAIDITASGLRIPQIHALIPKVYLPATLMLTSPVQITARAEGPAKEVVVTGQAKVKVLKFNFVPWHDVFAKFRYQKGEVSITGLRGHGSPRKLEMDLDIEWGKGKQPQTKATFNLIDVPVNTFAQMLALKGLDLQGLASVNGSVNLDQTRSASGHFIIRNAILHGVPLGRLEGDFDYSNTRVRIRRARMNGTAAKGEFEVSIVLPNHYQLSAKLSNANLSELIQADEKSGLSGNFPVSVRASGAWREARSQGTIQTGPGQLQGRAFKSLKAEFDLYPQRIHLSEVSAELPRGKYQGTIDITDWRQNFKTATISGRLMVNDIALRDWLPLQYAGLVTQGSADGVAEIGGTISDPRVRLDLQLRGITAVGLSFPGGAMNLTYQAGAVIINKIDITETTAGLKITGSGRPDLLAFELSGQEVDLAALTRQAGRRFGLDITGKANLQATITGSLSKLKANFSLTSDSTTINDIPFQKIVFTGQLANGVLNLTEASIKQGESSLSAQGQYPLPSGEFDLEVQAVGLNLFTAQLLLDRAAWRLYRSGVTIKQAGLYGAVPRPVAGILNAKAHITGPRDDPQAQAALELGQFGFAGRTISQVTGEILLTRKEIGIALRALHETAYATISGAIAPRGNLSLTVDIGNLDLNVIRPWLRQPLDLAGKATVNVDATGPTAQPALRGDIYLDNPKVGPFEFEAVSANSIRVSRGILSIDELRIRNGSMEAVGQASFPLTPTLALPKAELHIKGGRFAPLAQMNPAIFDADMYLLGNRLHLRQPSAEEGMPAVPGVRGAIGSGKFFVEGDVEIRSFSPQGWMRNRYDLTCNLDPIDLVIPGLVNGKLAGELILTNNERTGRWLLTTPERKPLILSHAILGAPGQLTTKAPLLPIPPSVRVRVLVGQKVEFRYGPHDRGTRILIEPGAVPEDGPPTGFLDIDGVLSGAGMTLNGEADSSKGVLAFPNGNLDLVSGRAWISRNPDQRPRITVSAEAEGRVGDYQVLINPTGQIYPPMETVTAGEVEASPLQLNASAIPYLAQPYVLAMLVGPVVAPTRAQSTDIAALLGQPTNGGAGQITGFMLPTFGSALGLHQLSLDLSFRGLTRLRIGERFFKRFTISYIEALNGPPQTHTVQINYEITPRISLGWGRNELEKNQFNVQSFIQF